MLQGMAHDASANSTSVVAIMHATAVNQDGRSSSLTAPNGPSQQGAIRSALEASGLQPDHLNALQLHGTGNCTYTVCLLCSWAA